MAGDLSPSSKSAFEDGPTLKLQTYIPEVVRSFSPFTLQRQMGILRTFVGHFAQHGAASFLHPCLYDSPLPEPLQRASQICSSYRVNGGPSPSLRPEDIRSQASHTLHLAATAGTFPELVAHVQAIAFLRILCLLEGQGDCGEETERDDKLFGELTLSLYIQAPAQLPGMLSPWQAWLFAESVRRTILVSYIILAVHGALRRGYAVHLLCVEALPFDMRAQLWDADTADTWEAATAASHDPALVSLRQFTALPEPTRGATPFEKLLILSFT